MNYAPPYCHAMISTVTLKEAVPMNDAVPRDAKNNLSTDVASKSTVSTCKQPKLQLEPTQQTVRDNIGINEYPLKRSSVKSTEWHIRCTDSVY